MGLEGTWRGHQVRARHTRLRGASQHKGHSCRHSGPPEKVHRCLNLSWHRMPLSSKASRHTSERVSPCLKEGETRQACKPDSSMQRRWGVCVCACVGGTFQ